MPSTGMALTYITTLVMKATESSRNCVKTPTRVFVTSGPCSNWSLRKDPQYLAEQSNTTRTLPGFWGWNTGWWGRYHFSLCNCSSVVTFRAWLLCHEVCMFFMQGCVLLKAFLEHLKSGSAWGLLFSRWGGSFSMVDWSHSGRLRVLLYLPWCLKRADHSGTLTF